MTWALNIYRTSHWNGAPEAATATDTGATADPPNLDPSWGVEDTLWIAAAAYTTNSTTPPSTPDGYAGRVLSSQLLTTRTCAASARRVLAAEAENPGTFGLPSSGVWAAATIAVRPPA